MRYIQPESTNTMKDSFLKFTAFVLFILCYTASCAQSTEDINTSVIVDSSNSNIAIKSTADAFDLKVKKRNNSVLLEWTIEKETDKVLFEIERSNDGKKFYQLEKKSLQIISSKTQYSYLDQNPLPVNYYRIKLIDKEGKYSYSKVTNLSQNGSFYSSVQPNPFVQNFTVQTYLTYSELIKIQLLDMSGKLIRYKSVNGVAGANKIELADLAGLQPGVYMIRIVTANSITEKKLLKGSL